MGNVPLVIAFGRASRDCSLHFFPTSRNVKYIEVWILGPLQGVVGIGSSVGGVEQKASVQFMVNIIQLCDMAYQSRNVNCLWTSKATELHVG